MVQASSKNITKSVAMIAAAFCVTATALQANAQFHSNHPSRGGFEDGRSGRDDRGRPDRGSHRRDITNRYEAERLVELIYRGALNRTADYGGLTNHARLIIEQGEQGLLEVARGIGGSQEFRNLVRQDGSGRVVENMYYVFFNRRPDSAGYRTWQRLIDQGRGAEAVAGIVGSQEFRQKQL